MSVILMLLLPLVATALVCLPFKRPWAAAVTVISCLTILVLAGRVAWMVSVGNSLTAALKVGMLKWIAVDGLSALILLLIALVGSTAAIFSMGYMAQENLAPRKLLIYYTNYNLFIFSMLAIPVMGRADAGLDRGRIDNALFRVARLL
jgi:hydrogenase-4 component F